MTDAAQASTVPTGSILEDRIIKAVVRAGTSAMFYEIIPWAGGLEWLLRHHEFIEEHAWLPYELGLHTMSGQGITPPHAGNLDPNLKHTLNKETRFYPFDWDPDKKEDVEKLNITVGKRKNPEGGNECVVAQLSIGKYVLVKKTHSSEHEAVDKLMKGVNSLVAIWSEVERLRSCEESDWV